MASAWHTFGEWSRRCPTDAPGAADNLPVSRVKGAVLLAIPTVALALLAWFAVAVVGHAGTACASWALQYRHARDDLATVTQLWQASRPGGRRPPDRADFQTRVDGLAAARPARCDNNGRSTS
jgi:hypothetical protein